jgi:hypothetical protein
MSALYSERGKMRSTPALCECKRVSRSPAPVPDHSARLRSVVARNVYRYPKRRRSITGAKWAVRLNGSLVPARETNRD